MILDIVNEVVGKEEVFYKAEVNGLEAIYSAIDNEDYSTVKTLSLEQIDKGCLDPRYVIYAEFGYWHEAVESNIKGEILIELIEIHQFFLEKIEDGKIRFKVYLAILEWLHSSMLAHAKFIKSKSDSYSEEDKGALERAFDEYILFIKANFEDINIAQIYQIKDIYKTLKVTQEIEDVDQVENQSEQCNEVSDTKEQCEDHSLNHSDFYISDEWSKLLRNIRIYRKLINEKSWLRAAVVYQVINTALKEFDPIKYFPETFYSYLKDTVNAYDHLMHQLSLSNNPLWLMLSQTFSSDPESFSTDDSLDNTREVLAKQVSSSFTDQPQQYETAMSNDEQDQLNW
ncbi:type VI secretion system protein IglI family protein [Francisella sp. 19X1-34]|uniref:type VI secretion system protein IglI family protein n=1 Tax=Francisella sp. 19X1-34 TaxID=3087177 RepID=UPI002E3516BC|nr:type VI secretion system protein IglI family protein [Francisella sp. 19X1-34]MED7788113.1 type VI secretion system protein IglI family protein [Francisella sp. 19X1-34]